MHAHFAFLLDYLDLLNIHFFPAQRTHWIVADSEKKHLISGDKKHLKNIYISGEKQTFFQLCFFACFFRHPH